VEVKNKKTFYELWRRGRFGNTLRSWADMQSFRAARYTGITGLRDMRPGGTFIKDIPAANVERHFIAETHVICEAASDERLTIQGEIQLSSYCGYDLRYSIVPGYRMRDGLARFQQHASGLNALCQVRSRMDPASWDDLREILEDYPGAVVEFSCYAMEVGNCRGRNTIFWEVRTDY